MKFKELNTLMGVNLRALRLESKLTQEQLAGRLGIAGGLIPRWETGSKGFSKSVILKLCEIFNVKPYVFYMDDRSALITSHHERKIVYKLREAEKLGVDDLIVEHCDVIIDWGKRKQRAASKDILVSQQEKMSMAKNIRDYGRPRINDKSRRSQ